jgi:thioredoxin-dependent peroxiredoxin
MSVGVGEPAPPFTLPGVAGDERRDWSLEEFRGRPVVLVFYPGDNTPVCTRQLNAYNDDLQRFEAVGAQILAISPQSVDSHVRFSDRQGGFAFPMLADIDKAVGQSYGILGPLGFYRRSVFVVDEAGVIRYAHRAMVGATFRSTDELAAAVENRAV